jgi:transglutaminase-like putative cysteine protease
VTVSPLVDIRARLVSQANVEVFSVQANGRAYWRLTSLDAFDGSIWSSNGIYRPVPKHLSVTGGSSVHGTKISQHYSIIALNSTWLPAAYEPTHVGNLAGVGYDDLSGSLLPAQPTSDSLDYVVESDVAASHLTAALLQAASGAKVPTKIAKRYLPLPTIPPSVLAEAQRVAGTGSSYQRARALEDYFRSGAFVYDLNVPGGHDDRAMERFLFRTKRGFCEQFAGTYAVMARAVGLPTRVAVGFTPGQLAADGQTFRVFSLNAHAWPEVWMGTAGWVAFEPTPGRGVPGGQAYTGVPEAQAQPEATTTPSSVPTTASTPAATATTDPTNKRSRIETSAPKHTTRVGGFVWFLVVLAVFALAWLAVVPTLHRVQRRRRHGLARSPAEQILSAFDDADRALTRLGRGRRASETPAEWARRASREGHLPAELAGALTGLATQAGAAWFSPAPAAPEAVAFSRQAADAVETYVQSRSTRRQRLTWALDPRPLLGGWAPSPSHAPKQSAPRAAA